MWASPIWLWVMEADNKRPCDFVIAIMINNDEKFWKISDILILFSWEGFKY